MTRDEAVREAVEKAGALEVAIPYGRLVQMETAARHAYDAGYAAAKEDAVKAIQERREAWAHAGNYVEASIAGIFADILDVLEAK